MNYSFEYIDIILLAMIAGFIFLRLRGILGKRTGHEEDMSANFSQDFATKNEKIIYASTHHYDKKCPPKPDFSKGYVWKLHESYDIFSANSDGSQIKQITNEGGYDAEATVALDGSRIVYTSIVSGDLEIWTMNTDGSDKRMLTNKLGYDGGAFFSHDAKKIIWRAFYPETEKEIKDYKGLISESLIRPMNLQLRIMNSDGTDKQQITFNEGANFAPYFFPNDKRVIFCSNMADPKGRDFDLWAVNIVYLHQIATKPKEEIQIFL